MGRSMAGLVASVLIFGVLAAAMLGALGTSASVTPIAGAPIEDAPHDGTFTVTSKRSEGGFEALGIAWRSPDYHLRISAIVPLECVSFDADGQPQLNPGDSCPSLPDRAIPAGGGVTAGGDGIVSADIEVSRACHDAIALGAAWPATLAECASD